jgi:hypothetical protein
MGGGQKRRLVRAVRLQRARCHLVSRCSLYGAALGNAVSGSAPDNRGQRTKGGTAYRRSATSSISIAWLIAAFTCKSVVS